MRRFVPLSGTVVGIRVFKAGGGKVEISYFGKRQTCHLTCAQLRQAAAAIAAHLQSLGVEGERVLLLYPPGLDFIKTILGCLYAGVVASVVERRHYWIEAGTDVAEPAGSELRQKPEIADWFYLPSWKPSLPPAVREESTLPSSWLVLRERKNVLVES